MISRSKLNIKLKKIDAIIIVILIFIAGLVLVRAGHIVPLQDDESDTTQDDEKDIPLPPLPTPPESITMGYTRGVSPEDEGVHFDKISI